MPRATFRVDPATPRQVSAPRAAVPGVGRGPLAILVAHGMGQQMPFQTLDDVIVGLRAHAPTSPQEETTVVKTVVAGKERLQRIETTVSLPDGSKRDLHIYEAYWAPLTEGAVTLRDVMGFLFRAGVFGVIWGTLQPFRRWMFGRYEDFRAPLGTILSLLMALGFVASLVWLTTLILAIAAARAPLQTPPTWLSPALFSDITTILNGLVASFALFAALLGLSRVSRRVELLRRAFGWLSVAAFVLALFITIAAALIAAAAVVYHARSSLGGASSVFDRLGWAAQATALDRVMDTLLLRRGVAWPLVLGVAAIVRSFLIQYVGDVAAYVQPQLLDRFADLRQKIKDTVWRTARAVYSEPYEDVILVGHSLGSVILYDVFNRLVIDEQVHAEDAPSIGGRTRLLLTFGSPLDKTAFIFGILGRRSEAREALAAAVQPLITNEQIRPRWINIYSRWDLISGSLDYYDLPDRSNAHPIDNITDPQSTTLLAAHVEYWRNPLLFRTILGYLQ